MKLSQQAIEELCVPNEETGCMEWTGSFNSNGVPVLRRPGERKHTPVRKVVLELAGRWLPGRLATNRCQNPACVAEAHAVAWTRGLLQQHISDLLQYQKRPTRNHAIAKKARERSRLDEKTVRDMRAAGLSSRQAAAQFGIGQSAACHILSGRTWKNYADPVTQLLAANDATRRKQA